MFEIGYSKFKAPGPTVTGFRFQADPETIPSRTSSQLTPQNQVFRAKNLYSRPRLRGGDKLARERQTLFLQQELYRTNLVLYFWCVNTKKPKKIEKRYVFIPIIEIIGLCITNETKNL